MENLYRPIEAKVEAIIDESPNIKSFILKPEKEFQFKTGQFIELTLPGYGEAPFTPSSSPFISDKMEVTIMKAGYLTDKFHKLNSGVTVGIRGPYGQGYPVNEFEGKEVLILGGGVGLAPLRSLLLTLIAEKEKYKRIILCYGAKTPSDIIYKNQFKEWEQAGVEIHRSVDKADENWNETVGVVTVLLDKLQIDTKNAVVAVCGPPVMMKFATLKLLEKGFKEENIYLSMERNMSCGIGKCGHCVMDSFFVCKDGPVFKYSIIKHIPEVFV